MANRVELNDENLEQVAGGKFTFFTQDGQPKCTVTGYGTFTTTADGVFKYMTIRNTNPGLSEAEYYQMCIDQHVIW